MLKRFEFELTPVYSATVHGYRAQLGPFGDMDVRAVVTKQSGRPNQSVLRGEGFPEAVFTSGREGGRPSLPGGRLTVDGVDVRTDFQGRGFRKASRWLDIHYRGREYTYRSTGPVGPGRDVTLRRPGALVGFRRAVRKMGIERVGVAEGEVDPADLAIALVLEPVDTSCLTRAGAFLDAAIGVLARGNPADGNVAE
ncbi:hypothetical protein [Streptomyces violascens]|uniref:hypothetical protein n=1 Tax=Streptomyces violascens TaxID=67381 RepID=UPI00365758D1